VLLPIEVIEEIDRFKRESTELGQNARTVSRMLDGLRAQGHLSQGVQLPNGGRLQIIFQKKREAQNGHAVFGDNTVDNRILSLAFNVQKAHPRHKTVLVTKDLNLRLKADALGVPAEDYETDHVLIKDLYTGMFELTVSAADLAAFRANSEMVLDPCRHYSPNEYCTLSEETNSKRTLLTRVDVTGAKLVPILDSRDGV
jgi:PhoH-like ATPase